jgi:hypothetical protein
MSSGIAGAWPSVWGVVGVVGTEGTEGTTETVVGSGVAAGGESDVSIRPIAARIAAMASTATPAAGIHQRRFGRGSLSSCRSSISPTLSMLRSSTPGSPLNRSAGRNVRRMW